MAEYYYTQGTDRHGPIQLTELQELVTSGQVAGSEYYWTTGMADWATVNSSSLFGTVTSAETTASPATPSTMEAATPTDPIPSMVTGTTPYVATPGPADQPIPAAWSPEPTPSPTVVTDHSMVQRVAAKMPKPLWLVVYGIVTALSGALLAIPIVTIPFAAVVIWMAVMLFKANSGLENARRTGSLESLEKAASNLNTYFAIITIMTALSILFSIVALAAVVSFGSSWSDIANF